MAEATIEFAKVTDNVVVIKIQGRANFQNSMNLQNITHRLQEENKSIRFIIDLEHCISLDSTFMGTLAGISVEQNKALGAYLTVVNTQEHTHYLLTNLGLSYILDIREEEEVQAKEGDFRKAESMEPAPQFEQIVHMINAHEQLIDLDSKNEVRFQSVLKYLKESLERERKKQDQPPSTNT